MQLIPALSVENNILDIPSSDMHQIQGKVDEVICLIPHHHFLNVLNPKIEISEGSKATNPSSEGKSNKVLSRARSVIRLLESALEKKIERLKDIIKDLEETILITSMEIWDQEEESPAYFLEDSSEGNFDENNR